MILPSIIHGTIVFPPESNAYVFHIVLRVIDPVLILVLIFFAHWIHTNRSDAEAKLPKRIRIDSERLLKIGTALIIMATLVTALSMYRQRIPQICGIPITALMLGVAVALLMIPQLMEWNASIVAATLVITGIIRLRVLPQPFPLVDLTAWLPAIVLGVFCIFLSERSKLTRVLALCLPIFLAVTDFFLPSPILQ